jgi:MFS family permease
MKQITSFLFVLAIGGAFFSGILSDWLVKKKGLAFGRRFVGTLGMGLAGLFLIVTATSASNIIAVTSLLICGFCYSFFAITAFSTCVDIGGAKAGTMTGIMNFCGQIGAFFLSIVFGKIADAVNNYNTPVLLIAGILISGSLVWLCIDPTNKIENLKADHMARSRN